MLPDVEDDDIYLRAALARYQPDVPFGLATRIVACATAQPQRIGVIGFITRALSEWDYALNVKGAALAAIAVLGLLGGQLGDSNTRSALDVGTVMMADPNWTEEL